MSSYLYFNDNGGLVKKTQLEFSDNSRKILENRYLRKDETGEVCETPQQLLERISKTVAKPDEPYHSVDTSEVEFYNLLADKKFYPNSPTWTGAGTPLGQLAACFVLPVEDDLGKGEDSIFSTLRNAALIQQSGGGNGFSFSRLRSRGSVVRSSNGASSGPVGFMKAYDGAFGVIAQGGIRKGANMGVLRVDHPDIREFIKCKTEEGNISNFNISVALTDEFLNAVENDVAYNLVDPHTGQVKESPKAREIFNMIVEYAHRNGEPGVLFIDTANKDNPVPHLYSLEATNPCGEQWLGPYENCCLGSINLANHVDDAGVIDWDDLRKTIILSTRFLDNIVTANGYVPSVPKLREAALTSRRIGLGIMGLADIFYKVGIRYGSEESQDLAGQVMEFVRFHSMKTSIELSRERGPFTAIQGSIYDPANIKWSPPAPLKSFSYNFGRPNVDWAEILEGIRFYGIRNAATTTIAPTGTISTVAGVEGYGCEPVFALAYNRNVYQAAGQEEKITLTYVSPSFERALEKLDLEVEVKQKIIDDVISRGTCQDILDLPQNIRETFVVSADIKPEEHIVMQASLQAFVDNSISKTCNFPSSATRDDVAKVFMMGWKLGCKGLTVYVSGSRQEVVLETKDLAKKNPADNLLEVSDKKIEIENGRAVLKRPYKLSGSTYSVQTPQGKAFITINKTLEGRPFEVFINVGKAGTDVAALAEALGRLVSGWLRVPSSSGETVSEIISQLYGIGGSRSVGFGKNKVSSIPGAVAKVLAEELGYALPKNGNHEENNGYENDSSDNIRSNAFSNTDMCPECGNYTLVLEEGCAKCYNCGFSVC